MENENTEVKKGAMPHIRVYPVNADKKIIEEQEITLWKNESKAGKKYFSGKDKKGLKYVGFFVEQK